MIVYTKKQKAYYSELTREELRNLRDFADVGILQGDNPKLAVRPMGATVTKVMIFLEEIDFQLTLSESPATN